MLWNRFSLFFKLSAHERRAYLLLILLIGLIMLIPLLYRACMDNTPPDTDSWAILQNKADLPAAPAEGDTQQEGADPAINNLGKPSARLFYFNPNNLPIEKWRLLGFSDPQIRVIKNYEAKGGSFATAADLAKIYSISEKDFKRIAPYLLLEENLNPNTNQAVATTPLSDKTPASLLLDINQADSAAFRRLKGIGPVFAARIVKYRESLGGFYDPAQLKEVYGLTAELFKAIQASLILKEGFVTRKIPINTVLETDLIKHPYFNKKTVQILLNYRAEHGPFKNIADLNIIYAFDSNFLRKIESYLSFN